MFAVNIPRTFSNKLLLFLLAVLLSCLIFSAVITALILLAAHDERYTHIIMIPLISAGLFYAQRRPKLHESSASPRFGAPLLLLGLGLFLVTKVWPTLAFVLNISAAGLVLVWFGLFISFYGVRVFYQAGAPLLLLFLIVPIPSPLLDKVVSVLQIASAEVSYRLFRIAGIPVFKHGTVMSLPGVQIEVAPECSGIRSTMALFITGIVLAELSLRSSFGKLVVLLCIAPIGILRNAIRIVTIALLGTYVNKDFFYGNLHRRGGLAFALVGFAILIPIVRLLRLREQRTASEPPRLRIGVREAEG